MDTQPVVQLVGKRKSAYISKESGQLITYKELYVLYPYQSPEDSDWDDNAPGEYVEGNPTDKLRCPRGVNFDKLEVGESYILNYELRPAKNGMMAYLVGMSHADVSDAVPT